MFQKGNDRHRVAGPQDRFQRQLRQPRLWGGGERRTGRVVCFDAEALQLRCHAPRQPAVRCYQRCLRRTPRAGRFKRQPQSHRDGCCLLALIGGFYQRGRCEGVVEKAGLPVLAPAIPAAGGFGRRKCGRKHGCSLFQIAIDGADLNHVVAQDAELLQ